MSQKYTEEQIKFVKDQAEKTDKAWSEISVKFNEKFGTLKTPNALRKMLDVYGELPDDELIKRLAENKKLKAENEKIKKVQSVLVDQQITLHETLEQLKIAVKNIGLHKHELPKINLDKNKKEMAIGINVNDTHIGAKNKNNDLRILESRFQKYSETALKEIKRQEEQFNVTTIILGLLGDYYENALLHGIHSAVGCEIQTPEQIRLAVEWLYKYFIYPLAKTGKKLIIPAVCDNHSRMTKEKMHHETGKTSMTWVIYNLLKFMADQQGFKNIQWIIPDGVFAIVQLWDKYILYEHSDLMKGKAEDVVEKHLQRRGVQVNKMLSYGIYGDKHVSMIYNKGRHIFCGALVSGGGYSENLGYHGIASQTIVYYVKRKGDYIYKIFPLDLESEE